MTEYPDDFTNVPETIGELRITKNPNATSWSPRDVLINTLRDIDSGILKPDTLVVCMSYPKNETHERDVGFYTSFIDRFVAIGMLERIKSKFISHGDSV